MNNNVPQSPPLSFKHFAEPANTIKSRTARVLCGVFGALCLIVVLSCTTSSSTAPLSPLSTDDITAMYGDFTADPTGITLMGRNIIITFANSDASTVTGSIVIVDQTTPPAYSVMPPEGLTFNDPAGIEATDVDVGTITVTPLDDMRMPITASAVEYTVSINFLPRITVALSGPALMGEVTAGVSSASPTDVTLKPCAIFAFTDVIYSVLLGGEVNAKYTAMFTSDIPSSYYDDTTATNNTNAATITIQDSSEIAVGTVAATITIQDCSTSSFFLAGSGTSGDPWIVDNDLRLDLVSKLVNSTDSDHSTYRGDHYKMTKNIDLGRAEAPWSKTASELETPAGKGFTPIGTTKSATTADLDDHTNTFTGNFNCDGKVISNLFISNTADSGMNNGAFEGLFGIVGKKATVRPIAAAAAPGTVRNCGLTNANITGAYTVGGLVGYLAAGSVTHSYVEAVTVTVEHSVPSTDTVVGGLVGSNDGMIATSYATGVVTNSGSVTGGLAGVNDGTIMNSYTTASVKGKANVGGLIGTIYNDRDSDTINSYAIGFVTGEENVGGLLGLSCGGVIITASYWATDATGPMEEVHATKSIGNRPSPGVLGRMRAQLQGMPVLTPEMIEDPPGSGMMIPNPDLVYVGWEPTIWNFTAGQYPRLINVPCANGYNADGNCITPQP